MAHDYQQKLESVLDRYIEKFSALEKEKERALLQYKKYLDAMNLKKRQPHV